MDVVRDAWLQLTTESAIDPGLPICDPHHHLGENHPPPLRQVPP